MNPSELANRVLESCASTNDCARSLGEAGYPQGAWVSSRRQEAGRGRLGRQWVSAEGNLFLSMLARPEDKALWTWVPLASAVATARACRELRPAADVRIKWPNDLWIDGAKLGGILCEAVGNRDGSFIVIGLGLNCEVAPDGLDQGTASLGVPVDAVREAVVDSLRAALAELGERGRDALAKVASAYGELAALPAGTEIEWASGQPGAPVSSGVVVGLGPSAELLVRDAGGTPAKLYAEDVKVRPRASCGSPA